MQKYMRLEGPTIIDKVVLLHPERFGKEDATKIKVFLENYIFDTNEQKIANKIS